MYDESTVYIIGHGKTSLDNAITDKFKIFFIGFVIDTENDLIIDLSCASTISTTEKFIASIFIGKKFDKYYKEIEEEILTRYFGSSQKAIITAYKDAFRRYKKIISNYY